MKTLISENLKRLRRVKGWSQRELSRRSGVSQSEISRIESSENIPNVQTVRKLAKILGQDPTHLYDGEHMHTLENVKRSKQLTVEDAIKREEGQTRIGRELRKLQNLHELDQMTIKSLIEDLCFERKAALVFGAISGAVLTFGLIMFFIGLLS